MKRLALLLLLLLAAAPSRADVESHADLTPGTYVVRVSGMICTLCSKALVAELAALEAVDKARADWERGEILVTIKPAQYLSFSQLRRAVRRASKKVNLGNKLEVQSVRYRP